MIRVMSATSLFLCSILSGLTYFLGLKKCCKLGDNGLPSDKECYYTWGSCKTGWGEKKE
jgi:hypothetical protein